MQSQPHSPVSGACSHGVGRGGTCGTQLPLLLDELDDCEEDDELRDSPLADEALDLLLELELIDCDEVELNCSDELELSLEGLDELELLELELCPREDDEDDSDSEEELESLELELIPSDDWEELDDSEKCPPGELSLLLDEEEFEEEEELVSVLFDEFTGMAGFLVLQGNGKC